MPQRGCDPPVPGCRKRTSGSGAHTPTPDVGSKCPPATLAGPTVWVAGPLNGAGGSHGRGVRQPFDARAGAGATRPSRTPLRPAAAAGATSRARAAVLLLPMGRCADSCSERHAVHAISMRDAPGSAVRAKRDSCAITPMRLTAPATAPCSRGPCSCVPGRSARLAQPCFGHCGGPFVERAASCAGMYLIYM